MVNCCFSSSASASSSCSSYSVTRAAAAERTGSVIRIKSQFVISWNLQAKGLKLFRVGGGGGGGGSGDGGYQIANIYYSSQWATTTHNPPAPSEEEEMFLCCVLNGLHIFKKVTRSSSAVAGTNSNNNNIKELISEIFAPFLDNLSPTPLASLSLGGSMKYMMAALLVVEKILCLRFISNQCPGLFTRTVESGWPISCWARAEQNRNIWRRCDFKGECNKIAR